MGKDDRTKGGESMKEEQFIELNIQTTLIAINNTPDGLHKKDLVRKLKRLYRKKRLMKRGSK